MLKDPSVNLFGLAENKRERLIGSLEQSNIHNQFSPLQARFQLRLVRCRAKCSGGCSSNGGGYISQSQQPALPAAMKILTWNVRGLRKSRTRLPIKKILHIHRPQIFFFCRKTKMTAQQVYFICRNFNFENRFVVDRNGMGCEWDLALFQTQMLMSL